MTHGIQVIRRNGNCEYGSGLQRRSACIKQRFRRRPTNTVSRLLCLAQDLNKKLPLLNVCVLFSMEKYMLRMGSCVRFCCNNILFLLAKWKPKANFLQKNQLYSSTGDDDFSPTSHQAVSLQVAPFLRDCKGRGYRRRAGQTENEWVYCHLIQVNLI